MLQVESAIRRIRLQEAGLNEVIENISQPSKCNFDVAPVMFHNEANSSEMYSIGIQVTLIITFFNSMKSMAFVFLKDRILSLSMLSLLVKITLIANRVCFKTVSISILFYAALLLLQSLLLLFSITH